MSFAEQLDRLGIDPTASVLTVEEAARVLRIGRSAAYAAARRGDLPVLRIGRTWRCPRHALEAMLDPGEEGNHAG